MAELETLLTGVLAELQKLRHPAFEAELLEGLKRALLRQEATSADLVNLLRALDHDLRWLRKHIAELHTRFAELSARLDAERNP